MNVIFNDLPLEIVFHIGSMLDIKSFYNLMLTHKRLAWYVIDHKLSVMKLFTTTISTKIRVQRNNNSFHLISINDNSNFLLHDISRFLYTMKPECIDGTHCILCKKQYYMLPSGKRVKSYTGLITEIICKVYKRDIEVKRTIVQQVYTTDGEVCKIVNFDTNNNVLSLQHFTQDIDKKN